jgi:demethylmenaquinone methyltransferase/2-methoxy-6-polyprenyl-1,4-benzoquinol methylase
VTKIVTAGKQRTVALVRGDAMRLPVGDSTCDAVTVAFGIRNVEQADVACREMARSLKPGGRLAILEFGVPRVPGLRALYQWYFNQVLPRLGQLVSGHSAAYSYLPASVGAFPPPPEFVKVLEQSGFSNVRAVPLSFGIVYLYVARKP